MKKLSLLIVALICAVVIANGAKPVKVIFDTDMGNDVDDVVALDMFYKYLDRGEVELLGIISSKRELGSVKFIDAMNTLYGYPDIPVGLVKTYPEEEYTCTDKRLNYADYTVAAHNYHHTIKDWEAVEDGYKLIRKLLASQPDKSVTFVTVGFSTNMARLLASPADDHSPLDGKSLMAQKADKVVIMAGNFHERKKEYNIYKDHFAAVRFIAECPVPMYFTDFSLGKSTLYPYQCVEQGFKYAETDTFETSTGCHWFFHDGVQRYIFYCTLRQFTNCFVNVFVFTDSFIDATFFCNNLTWSVWIQFFCCFCIQP